MSGENRRPTSWLLPVIVAAVGAVFAINAAQNGALNAVPLTPLKWAGLAAMVAGAVVAFGKSPARKLIGVLVCGIGAIAVIYL